MAVDRELAERMVGLLREMIDLDAEATAALCVARVPCNEALAEHSTIQVDGDPGAARVGLLGVLNGLCGCYDDGPRKGWGAVAVLFDLESGRAFEARIVENTESGLMPRTAGSS